MTVKQLDRFIEMWQILTSCQLVEVTVEGVIKLKTMQVFGLLKQPLFLQI